MLVQYGLLETFCNDSNSILANKLTDLDKKLINVLNENGFHVKESFRTGGHDESIHHFTISVDSSTL